MHYFETHSSIAIRDKEIVLLKIHLKSYKKKLKVFNNYVYIIIVNNISR